MRRNFITALLLLVALIQGLPIIGVVGADQLTSLYGVEIVDPNLEILMRHRATLFGILGLFIGYAAFRRDLQPVAFLIAFAMVNSFFVLAFSVGDHNEAMERLVTADVIASVSLYFSMGLYYTNRTDS